MMCKSYLTKKDKPVEENLQDHSLARARQWEEKMKVFQPLSTAAVMTCLFSVHIHTSFSDTANEEDADGAAQEEARI